MSLQDQITEIGEIAQDLKAAVFAGGIEVVSELANRLSDLAVQMQDRLAAGDEDEDEDVPEDVPVPEEEPPPPAPEAGNERRSRR